MVKKNGKIIHFALHGPDDILPGVHSKEDLAPALDFFGHPFVDRLLPKTKHAQRWHITRVRPALRWFCNKYEVDVPPWLKGNGVYDNMTDEERQEVYGQPELAVSEFDDEDSPPPPEDAKDAEAAAPVAGKKKPAKKKPAKKKPAKKGKK
jgi:hypothetical protein